MPLHVMTSLHPRCPSSEPQPTHTESLTFNTGPYNQNKEAKGLRPGMPGSLGMSPGRSEWHSQWTQFLGQLRKDTKGPVMSLISGSQIQVGRRIYWAAFFFRNTNSHHSVTNAHDNVDEPQNDYPERSQTETSIFVCD